jgi:inositol phosphorylceramide synthase catalytic subunit
MPPPSFPTATAAPAGPATVPSHRTALLLTALGAAHLGITARTGGIRWEHLLADGLIIILPWLGVKGRRVALAFLPLWFSGVLVEWQKFLVLLGPIHTGDFRALELLFFRAGNPPVSWAEWLYVRPVLALDLLCGAAYALFIYEYFAVAIDFFFRDRERFHAFVWAFFVATLAGAVIYVLLPVAPPWYILEHGLGPADPRALGSAAGCARFDAFFGIHYFEGFYARNPNVFGAMPSLHVAYPLMVTLFTWNRGWAWRILTNAFTLLVSFAAVYLAHHYVLDVLAGYAVAVGSAWAGVQLGRRLGPREPAAVAPVVSPPRASNT